MMTHIRTIVVKVLSPFALALALVFSGPVLAMFQAPARAPVAAIEAANKSEFFKNMQTPAAYQG
jgi:hypothetical protein